jgi:hypothetical protein
MSNAEHRLKNEEVGQTCFQRLQACLPQAAFLSYLVHCTLYKVILSLASKKKTTYS